MFNHAIQSPLQAIAQVLRGTVTRRAAEPWSFGYGPQPTHRDLRHLSDRMLKDIGYDRVDTMSVESRQALDTLIIKQLW